MQRGGALIAYRHVLRGVPELEPQQEPTGPALLLLACQLAVYTVLLVVAIWGIAKWRSRQ